MKSNDDFFIERQNAVERMREMSRKSTVPDGIPVPHFAQKRETLKKENIKSGDFLSSLNLPFLNTLKDDGDLTLIIGLLFILYSEKADKFLLFALLYILL